MDLDQDHRTCQRKKEELLQLHLERLSGTVRVWLMQKESEEIMLHLTRVGCNFQAKSRYFVREAVGKIRRQANST